MNNHAFPAAGRFETPLRIRPTADIPDAAPLFSAGDTVMHPSEGVCTIEQLTPMAFSGTQKRLYYVLKPAEEKNSSKVYLPVFRGNSVLRRLLDKNDILSLIRRSGEYAGLFIPDSKQRKEAFFRILSEGNYAKIIRMIQEIRMENARREKEGKRPCAADEAVRVEAERLLHQEFSYVLGMSVEDTAAFIIRELSAL